VGGGVRGCAGSKLRCGLQLEVGRAAEELGRREKVRRAALGWSLLSFLGGVHFDDGEEEEFGPSEWTPVLGLSGVGSRCVLLGSVELEGYEMGRARRRSGIVTSILNGWQWGKESVLGQCR
jgi:hypothetical protein